ncbi:MAG: GNAT family N-acetyltransferase [Lachnospiraceae bacterium]|jgi:GNAT superfamily N-acetyltransferase|nr:GNAT family N-acetyltransferase [Lachnospiraceae bacterium]
MIFRKTQKSDREQVVSLWQQAREYFKEQRIDQWQDGYPDIETLKEDIRSGESYVLEDSHTGRILATAYISLAPEPDYREIFEGSWQWEYPYGVVHRVAVSPDHKGQGLAGILISHARDMCRERGAGSLRIDTHEDNRSMQRMLEKNGFTRRGVIYLGRDGARRIAFEGRV